MKKKKKVKEGKTKSLVHFLKKQPHQYVDQKFQQAHEEVFEEISCLDCANCCKTLGPRIKSSDIKRISKFLRFERLRLSSLISFKKRMLLK